MPGFDGTGPMGTGSMTGRGLGFCAVPVRDYGFEPYAMPYAGVRGYATRSLRPRSYNPYPYGTGRYGILQWGQLGRRPWRRGRGFGRRWWW